MKQENLENILSQFGLAQEEIEEQARKAAYYDKYLLIEEAGNLGFLSVLTQHFHDPHMDISLNECDLVEYKGMIREETILDILDNIFQNPQIARAGMSQLQKFLERGFEHIKNKTGGVAALEQVVKYLAGAETKQPEDKRVRHVSPEDLPEIQHLFEREYPARYRLVEKMYAPGSAFLLEEAGKIKGVCFTEIRRRKTGDYLYINQIFVKESERGREIYRLLLEQASWYAFSEDIQEIRGTSRDRVTSLYVRHGAVKLPETLEFYLVRYKLNKI